MWPKAIAQLIELLPHVSRLLPVADKYLNAKAADAEASRKAMEQMAEGLRGDLGQVTASHAGLYRQLNEQSEKLSSVAAEVRSTQAAVQFTVKHIAALEGRFAQIFVMLLIALAGLAVVLALLVVVLLRLH